MKKSTIIIFDKIVLSLYQKHHIMQPDTPLKKLIFDLVSGNLEKFEAIFLAIILGVIGLNTLSIDPSIIEPISLILLSLISMLYIMSAYKKLPESGTTEMEKYSQKLSGFGSAICLNGILFTIVGFPGSKAMMIAGVCALIVTIILILVKQQTQTLGNWIVIRLLFLAGIAATLFSLGLAK